MPFCFPSWSKYWKNSPSLIISPYPLQLCNQSLISLALLSRPPQNCHWFLSFLVCGHFRSPLISTLSPSPLGLVPTFMGLISWFCHIPCPLTCGWVLPMGASPGVWKVEEWDQGIYSPSPLSAGLQIRSSWIPTPKSLKATFCPSDPSTARAVLGFG